MLVMARLLRGIVCHLTFLFVCSFFFYLFIFFFAVSIVWFFTTMSSRSLIHSSEPSNLMLIPCSVFYIYVLYYLALIGSLLYILSPYWFSMALNSSLKFNEYFYDHYFELFIWLIIHHILFFSQSSVLLFCLKHTSLFLYFSFLSVILSIHFVNYLYPLVLKEVLCFFFVFFF